MTGGVRGAVAYNDDEGSWVELLFSLSMALRSIAGTKLESQKSE